MFEPDSQKRNEVAVDFDCRLVDDEEIYVRAAVDCETLTFLSDRYDCRSDCS